jgi:hypothetical protein
VCFTICSLVLAHVREGMMKLYVFNPQVIFLSSVVVLRILFSL